MSGFSEFMKIREAAAEAFTRGKTGEVVALSTSQEPASFFGPDGNILRGAAGVRSAYDEGGSQFGAGGDSRFEIVHAAEGGDIAYWAGVQEAVVEIGGRRVAMSLRVTELFRRENGEWKLVHRHADALRTDE
ncbi:nuclear transport factor 2 family protein [Aquamicrobium sp. LC103]|uniref:YybH family protein n=1 Tax=Aquamicrobium sp. LC103 TaxID=1120658 RepID=UPI000AF22844|nr:nuclear transport factor 2 family protein [Aquamicrobium sp. LC103]